MRELHPLPRLATRALRMAAAALVTASILAPATALAQGRVERERLVEAMSRQAGYDRTRTTQAARFQGGVYLELARRAIQDGQVPLLLIDHDDWFHAYLEAVGVSARDAPIWIRLPWQQGQDTLIDARLGAVVDRVEKGPEPRLALNVLMWWPEGPGSADSFEFEDLLSEPQVIVHNERTIHLRLLDYGDAIVFDQVEGARLRPLTGALGFLFRIIGLASVKQVRFAVADDGTMVVIGTAHKAFINVDADVTVHTDGRAERDVDPARPDLTALLDRLRRPMEVRYMGVDWERWERRVADR